MLAEAEELAAAAKSVGGRVATGRAARRRAWDRDARRVNEDLERRLDIARLAKQSERELCREPVARERVATAAHEGVAIRRALRLAFRDLEEVATLVDRGLADQIFN